MPDQKEHYLLATLECRPPDVAAITDSLWEFETLGIEEVPLEGPRHVQLRAYFAVEEEGKSHLSTRLEDTLARFDLSHWSIEIVQIDSTAWLSHYSDHFRGFPVTRRVYVHPPWDEPSTEHPLNILLEPSHGFGTGSHESTQLVIETLEKCTHPFRRILDFGTGSGILTVVMRHLHPGASVIACDIDPDAVGAARRTLLANGIEPLNLLVGSADALTPGFDLVAANLTCPLFRQLGGRLATLSRSDLIVSGFTEEQESLVLDSLGAGNSTDSYSVISRRSKRGWICCQLRRRA